MPPLHAVCKHQKPRSHTAQGWGVSNPSSACYCLTPLSFMFLSQTCSEQHHADPALLRRMRLCAWHLWRLSEGQYLSAPQWGLVVRTQSCTLSDSQGLGVSGTEQVFRKGFRRDVALQSWEGCWD